MCGRYNLRTPSHSWCQMFLPDLAPDELETPAAAFPKPRFNIAPTQSVALVRQSDRGFREVVPARWGFVPHWAQELSVGNRMINARGETVASKRSFKSAFSSRRCVLPADGYFEWLKTEDGKQPYLIERADDGILAMAGLWEVNKKATGDPILTCTIITTEANKTTSSIHDRMPVLLDIEDLQDWLDPGFANQERLQQMLVPAEEGLLSVQAVSRRVNSVKNDDPSCIEPIEPEAKQQSLF